MLNHNMLFSYHGTNMTPQIFCFGYGPPQIQGTLKLWYDLRLTEDPPVPGNDLSEKLAAHYRKWGLECAEKLSGEFAVIIHDTLTQQVTFFVDHMGSRTLYYTYTSNSLMIATTPHLLFSEGKIPRKPNLHAIAASTSLGFKLAHPESTYFESVHCAKARTLYTWHDGTLSEKLYWDPSWHAERLHFRNEEDYIDAFQALFAEVTAFHMQDNKPVMTLLSGGLDSSAITAMAAHLQEKKGATLTSLSAVLPPDHTGLTYDERAYIDLLNAPHLQKTMILDEWRGPFDVLFSDFFQTHTPNISSRYYLYQAFATHAIATGSRVILDGCFGEWGPSFHGQGYYAELLTCFKWKTLLQELYLHQKRYHTRWMGLGTLLKEVCMPCLPPTWQIKLSKRRDLRFSQTLSFIQQDFVERHGPDPRELQALHYSLQTVRPDHRYNQNAMLRLATRDPHIQSDHGQTVHFRYPYYDKRMIEFCLRLPGEFKVRHGYKRYAIRAGMKGLMPDALRFRTTKEPFSPDYHQRYNRQIQRAKEFLESVPISPLIQEFINIPQLQKALNETMETNRCHTVRDFTAMHSVPQALYWTAFLATFV
jgi:asparagine synthase (glutamine-hydrolysing)